MAESTGMDDINEFYWDNFFVKVEDKLFCVPRCEFVKLSEVFADMFRLPSGPTTLSEGQERDHPIVLKGYKKDDFTSLLKVMYPTASSLISGKDIELCLEKEEWVGVLKLSTIWDMTKIREYAIHMLSNVTLSPIEKIVLARAHRVDAWLDEGIASLVTCYPMPTFEDLAPLGWETVARILWFRDNLSPALSASKIFRFRRNAIKCAHCTSSSSLINDSNSSSYRCGHVASGDAELTISGFALLSETFDLFVPLGKIHCPICRMMPFYSIQVVCSFCSHTYNSSYNPNVLVTLNKSLKTIIDDEPRLPDSF